VGFTDFTGGSNSWKQISAGALVAPTNAVNALIDIFGATGGILNDFGGVLIDDVSLSGSTPTGPINILPATVRTAALFTGTVNADGGTASAASGSITFKTNNMLQSSALIANGTANGTPTAVPASYSVTAIYSGDATYIGSTNTLVVGTGVNPTPAAIITSVSGNHLTLTWPADHTGWTLQAQTNALNASLSPNNWHDVAGSTATNQAVITISPASPTVFYRMKF
jgi:hypothetical protein